MHRDPLPQPARIVSLDAYRGAVMLLMASAGLGLSEISAHFPDSGTWRFIGRQCDHATWDGCTLWDLIQPAFMFMVGVALPWSVASRVARGETFGRMFAHALWRSVLLVGLAVFLSSAWSRHTEWTFNNVLAQIGLGYPVLFLLAFAGPRTTWCVALGLLVAYWLAFALYPLPPSGFDWGSVGVGPDWAHLGGLGAHWEKNANLAAAFDVWFLNRFPREARYTSSAGGYQTLNFVPSLATMTFGLIAGRLLRGGIPLSGKVKRLVIAGIAGIVLGKSIEVAGLCPIVKRIWTPAFAIFSAGWVTLALAGFVAVVDGWGWKRLAFPLIVAGLNPITLYCLWQLSSSFIREQVRTHFGQGIFTAFGPTWRPLLERGVVLVFLWLIVWWMYRRKIFLRL
jgi:heparan-alpha-glucosaminide N-acetyltransferase